MTLLGYTVRVFITLAPCLACVLAAARRGGFGKVSMLRPSSAMCILHPEPRSVPRRGQGRVD